MPRAPARCWAVQEVLRRYGPSFEENLFGLSYKRKIQGKTILGRSTKKRHPYLNLRAKPKAFREVGTQRVKLRKWGNHVPSRSKSRSHQSKPPTPVACQVPGLDGTGFGIEPHYSKPNREGTQHPNTQRGIWARQFLAEPPVGWHFKRNQKEDRIHFGGSSPENS